MINTISKNWFLGFCMILIFMELFLHTVLKRTGLLFIDRFSWMSHYSNLNKQKQQKNPQNHIVFLITKVWEVQGWRHQGDLLTPDFWIIFDLFLSFLCLFSNQFSAPHPGPVRSAHVDRAPEAWSLLSVWGYLTSKLSLSAFHHGFLASCAMRNLPWAQFWHQSSHLH